MGGQPRISVNTNWVSMSEPHLIVLTCEPHTSCTRAVSIFHKTINLGHEMMLNMWQITLWHHTDTAYAIILCVQLLPLLRPTCEVICCVWGGGGGRPAMQYHLLMMVLAGYSNTLSLSVIGCWQHHMTPILTSLTLRNLSKPKPSHKWHMCSSLTLPHNVLHSPSN